MVANAGLSTKEPDVRALFVTAAIVIALSTARTSQVAADSTPVPGASAQSGIHALQPATFEGVTPCADCPGIRLTINVRQDRTYTLRRIYLERSTSFEEHGTWSYDAQRSLLTLTPPKGAPERFRVTFESTLHMLDTNDKPLPSSMPSTLEEVGQNVATLAGSGWTLVELAGKQLKASEAHPVTMQFDAAGDRVSGSGSCNRYSAAYTQDGDRLSFGALAATRMMCEDMAAEDAFFAMLAKVTNFVRTAQSREASLTLYDQDGKALARLGYEK